MRGDAGALARAIDNLLENALVHGPAGGAISSASSRDGGVARVTVTDEGPGLRAEETEHAFERFWRARPTGPGSGLGLAIVRATAERHGGRAYVEGATFTLELPLSGTSHESASVQRTTNRRKDRS